MSYSLPLSTMTVTEKLEALDLLWEDLRRGGDSIPSPEWHAQILAEREQAIRDGEAHFEDWEDVKARLRERLK